MRAAASVFMVVTVLPALGEFLAVDVLMVVAVLVPVCVCVEMVYTCLGGCIRSGG